ncbi:MULTISPECIES: dihydrofolate reductase family protein [Amycolatopsis]|uniref:Dihydrofolate reductase family protein n=1 Tax=Amycolatopsis tucumanensis TaxID=401106 RepID=A0ABP7IH46_9PSEU|nr:dihydrofolate reductase family protein [Amycolatopsis tucumanensis]MCF6425734.1 dihydrofolate reductase family protein [Amycolatopsis tucumanensis]
MGTLIVIEFVTLDGVVEDPDGSGGTPGGGWAFRHGPEAVAGDKFGLGALLDTGMLLLGRVTWELFAKLWPGRTDEFSAKMNAIPKLVVSRSLTSADAWQNSSVLDGDLASAVRGTDRDLIVTGSIGVVHALAAENLVDEYRLLVFPTALGTGRRLFTAPADLRLHAVRQQGAAALLTYRAATGKPPTSRS